MALGPLSISTPSPPPPPPSHAKSEPEVDLYGVSARFPQPLPVSHAGASGGVVLWHFDAVPTSTFPAIYVALAYGAVWDIFSHGVDATSTMTTSVMARARSSTIHGIIFVLIRYIFNIDIHSLQGVILKPQIITSTTTAGDHLCIPRKQR